MKPAAIKKLAQNHALEDLQKAEEAIIEEQTPSIEVEGDDEGDQLTNISGAIYVREQVDNHGVDMKTAVRNFTERVRNSIDGS